MFQRTLLERGLIQPEAEFCSTQKNVFFFELPTYRLSTAAGGLKIMLPLPESFT